MKGKYRIIVQNKKIKYDFEIKRNITIIRGESATGKTALVDMVREYYENGEESGVHLQCKRICAVLEGKTWKGQLSMIRESIIFIDEGNTFVSSKEFASEIQRTDNYYVIVTRESLASLPYSVNEIYGIRNSGKYGYLKQTYNELYRIYKFNDLNELVRPEKILTEDSNSGFQFFNIICKGSEISCVTAHGKSNIFQCLIDSDDSKILVIADGAAFGPEMEKVMKLLTVKNNIVLYLPESFEWIILQSGIFNDNELKQIMNMPYQYIESKDYLSWERFFTELLINKTQGKLQEKWENKLADVMKSSDLFCSWGKVNLTRPRRFGKSLNMSMLC